MSALEVVDFKPCCTGSDEFDRMEFIEIPRSDGTIAQVPLIGGGSYPNGQIPLSALKPIAGGGYLEANAAAAWNAMAAHIYKETGVRIAPAGPDSSYRPYARQVYWRNYWCASGPLRATLLSLARRTTGGVSQSMSSRTRSRTSRSTVRPSAIRSSGLMPRGRRGTSSTRRVTTAVAILGRIHRLLVDRSLPDSPQGRERRGRPRMQRRLRKWNDGLLKPEVDGSLR